MKVLFAGGGTGGHLYPAVAMAGELLRLVPDATVSFAGTKAGIEATEIPRLGYRLHLFPVRGLKRDWSLQALFGNLGVLADFASSLLKAVALIREERPDVVVGTGGFVSAPVLLAAQLTGCHSLIQEQNAFPGVTTRLLSQRASEVHLSFGEAKAYIHRRRGVFVSGNPARSFASVDGDTARKRFGLHEPIPTLLVFGGSRGARAINNAILEWIGTITERANLIWQTGALDHERISTRITLSGRVWCGAYIERMGDAYAAADLVLCRAGASSIAELANVGKPSVLVPYPHAAGNHQHRNAQALADVGAALLLDDAALAGASSKQRVLELLHDADRLSVMGAASGRLARPDAARRLAERIVQLAQP